MKRTTILATAAAIAITGSLSACTRTVEVPAAADTTPATTAAASTTEHTRAPAATAPPATAAPVISDKAANIAWAVDAMPTIEELGAEFTAMGDASTLTEMMAGCARILPLARDFGTGTPDTVAGRHAKAAADLYVQAANACLDGNLESSVDLLTRGGVELDAATAALDLD